METSLEVKSLPVMQILPE